MLASCTGSTARIVVLEEASGVASNSDDVRRDRNLPLHTANNDLVVT